MARRTAAPAGSDQVAAAAALRGDEEGRRLLQSLSTAAAARFTSMLSRACSGVDVRDA